MKNVIIHKTGYKLFHKRKDGSLGPLFINKKQRLNLQQWYEAEDIPTKGYAHRPGWHICDKPYAPHLKLKEDRVWCMVLFDHHAKEYVRPESQGGLWYTSEYMYILGEINLGNHS